LAQTRQFRLQRRDARRQVFSVLPLGFFRQ
jgi:hypothetical protein